MSLRDYQRVCVDGVRGAFESGDSAMCVMPTGTGKTHCFANVIAEWEREYGRVLVLAHRSELLHQAKGKIDACLREQGDMDATGIELGSLTTVSDYSLFGYRSKCIVASVQSMHSRRLEKFDPQDFGLVVVDECHHAVKKNKTYWNILRYFQEGGCKVLGVTATPDRSDEEALGGIFEQVAFQYEISDAISDGWLVPVYQEMVHVEDLDLSQVSVNMGDLAPGQLNDILSAEAMCHKVVTPTLEIVGDMKTMVFAAGIQQSRKMAEIFNRHKPGSAISIAGDIGKDDRGELLKRFKSGEYQFLCSCHVFTEGYDEPTVECIVQARPTKSRMLYAQMAGRGTRVLPGVVEGIGEPPDGYDVDVSGGVWRIKTAEQRRAAIAESAKKRLLLIDFVGNSGRHKLVYSGDFLGGDYSEEVVEATNLAMQQKADGPVDVSAELVAAKELVDIEAKEILKGIKAKAEFKRRSISPFDVLDLSSKREPGWHRGRVPSEKMIAVLRRAKIPLVFHLGKWHVGEEGKEASWEELSFHRAKEVISEIMRRREEGLCTYGQAKLLKRYGESGEVSFDDARTLIDKIAQRGWKKR